MIRKLIAVAFVLTVCALVIYCGGSDNKIDFGDTGTQDTTTVNDTGNGNNTDICSTCKSDQLCAYEKACVNKPTEESKATKDSQNNVFVNPEFGCITDSPVKPQGPEKVNGKGLC